MPDPKKPSDAAHDAGYFNSSDCDVLEIREEDTKPGKGLSERARKRWEEKYGKKKPPHNGAANDA